MKKYSKPAEGMKCQNNRGEWVPAICLPYYLSFGRCQCDCGETFWSEERYREHYALKHVMGL